jgi:hypothetical protein
MNWPLFLIGVVLTLLFAFIMTAMLRWLRRKKESVMPETIGQLRRDRDALYCAMTFICLWLFLWGDQVGKLISSFGHYSMIAVVFGLVGIYEGTRALLYLWERRHP